MMQELNVHIAGDEELSPLQRAAIAALFKQTGYLFTDAKKKLSSGEVVTVYHILSESELWRAVASHKAPRHAEDCHE